MSHHRARLLGALVLAFALCGAFFSGPATAATAASSAVRNPDVPCVTETPPAGSSFVPIRACASFDRTSYKSGWLVKLTVSVTNLGTTPAENVSLPIGGPSGDTNFQVWRGLPNGLGGPTAIEVQPGDTVRAEIDGYAWDPASGFVQFNGTAYENGTNYGGNVNVSASVTQDSGSYGGVVYTDTNGNGQPDPGEGLAGATVTLAGPYNGLAPTSKPVNYTATTDAQGDFQLSGLPAGQYSESFSAPGGWVPRSPTIGMITIDGSINQTNVQIVASRPLSETLKPSISFDQTSYQVGQVANLTVTLTNTGSTALTGIQAGCDPVGDASELTVTPAWGALGSLGGVTLPANSSTTFHVAETVPVEAAGGAGKVYAECRFGPEIEYFTPDYPSATANVPVVASTAPTTNVTVHLIASPETGGPNTLITLIDPATQSPIGWTFGPDQNGDAVFDGVPDGSYGLTLGYGWKPAPGQSPVLNTADLGPNGVWDVQIVPKQPIQPLRAH